MGTDAPSRLPDPQRSRVLLVGTSQYDHLPDRPSVAANLDALESVLTDPDLGGLPREHCRVLREPANPVEVVDELEAVSAEAEDLLLVYLSGHGQLDDNHVTHFAVRETRKGRESYTAVSVDSLRRALHRSRAASKVLIVDTCYSGQALRALLKDTLAGPPDEALVASFDGVLVIASTGEFSTAMSRHGERMTAFTHELVALLRSGIPGGPPMVPISELFDVLRSRLVRKGLPEPRLASSDAVGRLALVRNLVSDITDEPTPDISVAQDAGVTFPRCVSPARFLSFSGTVGLALGAIWAFSDYGRSQHVEAWQFFLVAILGGTLGGLVATRMPDKYTFSIGADLIRLDVNQKVYSLYWTSVAQVTLEPRGGDRFDVRVRLMPGARPPVATGLRLGPRLAEPRVIRMVEVHRLAASPTEVDEALRRFGGTAWLRSPEVDALRAAPPTVPIGVRFTTKRAWLAVAAALALLAALSPLAALGAAPTPGQAVCVVLISALWLGPGLALTIVASRPVTLLVNRTGITFRRGQTETKLRWSEVDHIAVLGWNRRNWTPRFLYVRAPGLRCAPFWQRWLGLPPDVLVCDLLSLGTTGARMSAVLPEYAGRAWSPDWVPATELVTAGDRTIFDGKALSARTFGVGAAATIGTLVLISIYSAAPTDNDLFAMATFMTVMTLFGAGGLSLVLTRSRCKLTVDPVAVSITLGRRTERIEWQDISHARIARHDTITKNKRGQQDTVKTVHAVELELTEDARQPRAWNFTPCFRRRSEVIVLCPIDAATFTLNASIDAIETELARCAKPERWKPRTRHEHHR